jgi:NADH-quinone oxidoreductase subunit A
MDNTLEFFNIFIFFFILFLLSLIMLLINFFLSINYPYYEKLTSYECGFQPFNKVLINFDIKYYLIALLFLIFDIEIMFLLPWLFYLNYLTVISFFTMIFFLFIILLGFYYEWYKGGLEWN